MKATRIIVRGSSLGTFGKFLDYITSFGGRASVTLTRFLRFGVSSSLTLIVDIILLIFFVEFLAIYYLIASGLSFAISTSMNYLINREWGFRGTTTGLLHGYFLFLFFSFFGILLTVSLMWLFVDIFGMYYLWARVVVALIEGSLTFLAHHHFTFKMPDVFESTDYFD